MEQSAVSVMALLMATLVPPPARGVMTFDTGAGKEYKLRVTQDVTLERGSVNFNSLEYLIVSKHPGYPNKRSLVQFEDLPRSCPSSNILSAKMHLYYEYSHKASGSSFKTVPFIPRHLRVYLVKKPWDESQTTSTMRLRGIPWSSPWLALDGTTLRQLPSKELSLYFRTNPKVLWSLTSRIQWRTGVVEYLITAWWYAQQTSLILAGIHVLPATPTWIVRRMRLFWCAAAMVLISNYRNKGVAGPFIKVLWWRSFSHSSFVRLQLCCNSFLCNIFFPRLSINYSYLYGWSRRKLRKSLKRLAQYFVCKS